jgi:uncharacterized protein
VGVAIEVTERKKWTRRAVLGGLGVGALALGLGQLENRNDLRVERRTLRLPRWSAEGFKVAFLADLHMDSPAKAARAVRAARLAAVERPDLLLLGGDLVSHSEPRVLAVAVAGLESILDLGLPTYAVLGNHEYWSDDPALTVRTLAGSFGRKGCGLLRNQTVEVGGVVVNGIDDGLIGRDRHGHRADRNVVTLFHEPDFVSRIDRKASLMLAGHSHGGQICLPFGVPVKPPRGARKYVKGFFPRAPVPLYVTRGVGTVGPDRRTFCPPEVSVLTLRSA